jgi:hypothetical protein
MPACTENRMNCVRRVLLKGRSFERLRDGSLTRPR